MNKAELLTSTNFLEILKALSFIFLVFFCNDCKILRLALDLYVATFFFKTPDDLNLVFYIKEEETYLVVLNLTYKECDIFKENCKLVYKTNMKWINSIFRFKMHVWCLMFTIAYCALNNIKFVVTRNKYYYCGISGFK